jgi:hypothetical protein
VRSKDVHAFSGAESAAKQIGEHATTKIIHADARGCRCCVLHRGMASRNSI